MFGRIGLLFLVLGVAARRCGSWRSGCSGEPMRVRPLMLFGAGLVLLGIQFILMGLLGEMIAQHAARATDYPVRRRLRPRTAGAPMKAFVLAGGLGTRLRARFGDLPKPLAPIGGRPFLERQLEWLAAHGVREVVLCVGHGADQVRATLGDGARSACALAVLGRGPSRSAPAARSRRARAHASTGRRWC